MRLLRDIRRVAAFDFALFHERPRLLVAVIGAMFIPSLYSAIYLLSAWDPYNHLDTLPVAVVNLDEGVTVRGQHVIVGKALVDKIVSQKTFAFFPLANEDEARGKVTHGDAVFALVVPRDFSKLAVPASHEAPGRVKILFSEGNNFMAATIAKRFAGELAHGVNETLNEQRWRVVLETVDRSRGSVAQLRDGVDQLVDGSKRLEDGLAQAKAGTAQLRTGTSQAKDGSAQLAGGGAQVADGAAALVDGVKKIGGGLRTLDEKLPGADKLAQLTAGAHKVADGNAALAAGLGQLKSGSRKAKEGAGKLKDGTAKLPIVGGKIAGGAGELEDGLAKLEGGLGKAEDGAGALAAGSKQLDDGVGQLAGGVALAHDGIHTMVTKLPPDEKLDELAAGARKVADGNEELDDGLTQIHSGAVRLDDGVAQLHEGSARLHEGLALLQASLPQGVDALDGDARGLAASVEPELVALTSVGAYGNSMAPYFLGVSLWVGVVMAGFIFKLRWFPARLRTVFRVSRVALVLGRMAVPLAMALGQATLLTITMRFIIGVDVPSVIGLWVIAIVTSTTFLCVLLMLIGIFGDVGKAIALLLLVFQMSASAGVFPIELSLGVFRFVHPFLPFTWVVQATRAFLFGAFDGAWLPALVRVALFGVISVLLTTLFARWKLVARHEFGPLLDV